MQTLTFNINTYAELEFHRKVVFKHDDFLQQPAHKAFIKNGNLAGLSFQKIAKLSDSGQPFIPDDAVILAIWTADSGEAQNIIR